MSVIPCKLNVLSKQRKCGNRGCKNKATYEYKARGIYVFDSCSNEECRRAMSADAEDAENRFVDNQKSFKKEA